MVDVQYAWSDVERALNTLKDWADLDIYFIETPLQIDDLAGYARLHDESPVPIAAGEWQNTRFEFIDLMDIGPPLDLTGLQPGSWRAVTAAEQERLNRLISSSSSAGPRRGGHQLG